MNKLRAHWKENKSIWTLIAILFIATRLALFIGGYVSLTYLPHPGYQIVDAQIAAAHPYAHMWVVWDSNWYIKIATNGYADSIPFTPSKNTTIGFFPLYPSLMSVVELVTRDYLLAGMFVSNFFLILSAFLLYKIVRFDHDEAFAKRCIWYLFLFPSAYIFSAVYPESMVFCFWLASILFARKGIWPAAGLIGVLAALVKPQGFLIVIPLALIWLKAHVSDSWRPSSIIYSIRPSMFFALLPPLGLAIWAGACYYMTGDALAYSHVQQGAWHHYFSTPLHVLYQNLFNGPDYLFNSLTVIVALVILAFGYKKIPFSYWAFALAGTLFNATTGGVIGSWRYLASVFPFLIILAAWGKKDSADRALISSMAIFQGCMFVFWVAGYWFTS